MSERSEAEEGGGVDRRGKRTGASRVESSSAALAFLAAAGGATGISACSMPSTRSALRFCGASLAAESGAALAAERVTGMRGAVTAIGAGGWTAPPKKGTAMTV